jgi:hypothetical protein
MKRFTSYIFFFQNLSSTLLTLENVSVYIKELFFRNLGEDGLILVSYLFFCPLIIYCDFYFLA